MRTIGVIGLGYVGLPLAVAFAREDCHVIGVDVDARKVEAIEQGRSYVEDVSPQELADVGGRLEVGTRYAPLADAEAVLICVPTPLSRNREPDLGPLMEAGRALAGVLVADQLVVLESTTYPGTTRERVAAAAGGVGPVGGAGLPPGLLSRAGRPGTHRLHAAKHPEGRRRPDRGVRRARPRRSTAWSAMRSWASPAPRPLS